MVGVFFDREGLCHIEVAGVHFFAEHMAADPAVNEIFVAGCRLAFRHLENLAVQGRLLAGRVRVAGIAG